MDHTAAVKKYAPDADEKTIGAIVKHLGIALRNRDSSLVSCSDPGELKTVRESWCKKKLGLSGDAELDAAVASDSSGYLKCLREIETSTISTGPGGVAWCQIDEFFVVLLPAIEEGRQLSQVIDFLHELFECYQGCPNWLLDFSAIRQLSLLMIANVLTYRQQLERKGGRLHLCWVRPTALRDIFLERMKKAFRLKRVGGYYFSV